MKQLAFYAGEITITPYTDGRSRLRAFIETLICRCLSGKYFYQGQKMSLDPEDTKGLGVSEREDLQIIADFAAHWTEGIDGKMKCPRVDRRPQTSREARELAQLHGELWLCRESAFLPNRPGRIRALSTGERGLGTWWPR